MDEPACCTVMSRAATDIGRSCVFWMLFESSSSLSIKRHPVQASAFPRRIAKPIDVRQCVHRFGFWKVSAEASSYKRGSLPICACKAH